MAWSLCVTETSENHKPQVSHVHWGHFNDNLMIINNDNFNDNFNDN